MAYDSNKDVIEAIRLHSDIVETIGRYVPLKRYGQRFKALCPFHKEKTPSFQVDPDKQLYHCFGCGAGGDVFSFVMQYEQLDFPGAARLLADRAGIQFEARSSDGSSDPTDKQALYRLHEGLASFYADTLRSDPAAQTARAYLEKRALEPALKEFQLGFAPLQPGAVAHWAGRQSFPPELLEKAGVLLPSDRGGPPYDRFRGRLMFPIRNEQGRVVGFSGRALDPQANAKYVNSPETPLFKKSRLLYGLDRARTAMVDSRQALVCEGQIDVIRSQLAGFSTAVAPQGTALTEAHALLLKRYADEVVLVFDSDTAGQNAALRGAEALLREGLTVRIAALPAGEDPDSLIQQQGAEAFGKLIKDAFSLAAFHVRILQQRGELDTPAGRLRASRALLETIQHAPSAVQREQCLREAAQLLDVSEEALREDMRRSIRRPREVRPDDADGAEAAPPPDYPPHEAALIELMLGHPEVLDLVSRYVPPEAVTNATCRTLIQAILTLPDADQTGLMQVLADQDEACRRLAARLHMTTRTIDGDDISCITAAQDLILSLRIRLLERKIKECHRHLQAAPPEQQRHLENERSQLLVLKKKLESEHMQKRWEAAALILELDD